MHGPGHASRNSAKIFVVLFINCIAQIAIKYPNLFPEYLDSIESSVNSENTVARGQTKHMPLHSTITHLLDARACKLGMTHYKKCVKLDIVTMKFAH